MPEQLDALLIAVIDAATDEAGQPIAGVDIDYQASGQYPYRIRLQEEEIPIAGLVTVQGETQ